MTCVGTTAAAMKMELQLPNRVVTLGDTPFDPVLLLGIHRSDSDPVVLMTAMCLAKTRPDLQKLLGPCLSGVAMLRGSVVLQQARATIDKLVEQHEVYEAACQALGVSTDADDDVIKTQFLDLIQQQPATRDGMIEMLRLVVAGRENSALLKELLESFDQSAPQLVQPATIPQADPLRVVAPPFHDPNPHNRVRLPDMPVGLANCMNLCYFNSLIQAYFSIPGIRAMILKFVPSKDPRATSQQFILNLQMLFAFLQRTDRKYVSPMAAATSLVRPHALVGMQQDVHECNGWLLDSLESCLVTQDSPLSTLFRQYVTSLLVIGDML